MNAIRATLVSLSVTLLGGVALAESNEFHQSLQPPPAPPATTRPATQPRGGWEGLRNFRGGGMGPRFFLPFGENGPTDEQIKVAEKFVHDHSPYHYQAYERMEQKEPRAHEHMQLYMVRGFFDLQVVENNDRTLYDMKLHQIEVQDQIFGVIVKYKELGQIKETDKLHAELRPLEERLLELRKDESKHRLQRIEEAAAAENRNLANLESSGPKLVEGFIQQDIENSERLMTPFGFRRPERPGDR